MNYESIYQEAISKRSSDQMTNAFAIKQRMQRYYDQKTLFNKVRNISKKLK